MNAPGRVLLKITGILLTVFACVMISFILFVLLADKGLAGLFDNVADEKFDIYMIVSLCSNVLSFIIGILAVKFSAVPSKARACSVMAILLIAMQVALMIIGGNVSWISATGFALPLLLFIGALLNEKKA